MKKYNVLLVHNFYKVTGGEDTVFCNEKQMLIEKGNCIYEYTRDNREIDKLNVIRKVFLPFTNIFSLKTYRDIKKYIKKHKIDIVHVHNYNNLISPSIIYACKKCNVPIVQTIHNFRLLCPNGLLFRDNRICEECPRAGLKKSIKYRCYHKSRLQTFFVMLALKIHRKMKAYKYVNFIFLTEFNKSKFVEYNKSLKCFDEKKFFIKPNFVDENEIPELSEIRKKDQFIYAGRLSNEKGILDLINIWNKVNNEKLIVCGSGPLEKEIKNIVQNKKLNVEMLGQLKHKELLKKIAESKALIFPSRVYETFGLSILESFFVNTPVISYNLGNAALLNHHGYLFNNDEELINCIKKFDPNKEIIIEPGYTKKENYEILINIYDSIISRKGE